MAKVTVAMSRANLGPRHAVADIGVLDNIFGLDRFVKLGQPVWLSNLFDRSEQRFARHHVHINTWLFVVPIGVVKGALRAICCVTRYCSGERRTLPRDSCCMSAYVLLSIEGFCCGMQSKPKPRSAAVRHPTLNNMIGSHYLRHAAGRSGQSLAGRVYQLARVAHG